MPSVYGMGIPEGKGRVRGRGTPSQQAFLALVLHGVHARQAGKLYTNVVHKVLLDVSALTLES